MEIPWNFALQIKQFIIVGASISLLVDAFEHEAFFVECTSGWCLPIGIEIGCSSFEQMQVSFSGLSSLARRRACKRVDCCSVIAFKWAKSWVLVSKMRNCCQLIRNWIFLRKIEKKNINLSEYFAETKWDNGRGSPSTKAGKSLKNIVLFSKKNTFTFDRQ